MGRLYTRRRLRRAIRRLQTELDSGLCGYGKCLNYHTWVKHHGPTGDGHADDPSPEDVMMEALNSAW